MDELLEKYLSLSETEREAFEKELSAEQRVELARELGIMEGLNQEFRKELRSKVSAFEERSHRARKMNPAFIGIAASFLLISSLVVYLMRDEKSLFDQYYEVYPNYEVTSLRGVEDLSNRQLAYAAYDEGKFELAISQFNKMDSLAGSDYFFRGVSYIQLEKYDAALTDFVKVIGLQDKDYEDAARWYAALVNIKLDNSDIAFGYLNELSSSNEYSDSAKLIIDSLDKIQ